MRNSLLILGAAVAAVALEACAPKHISTPREGTEDEIVEALRQCRKTSLFQAVAMRMYEDDPATHARVDREVAACPSDTEKKVVFLAEFVCESNGGHLMASFRLSDVIDYEEPILESPERDCDAAEIALLPFATIEAAYNRYVVEKENGDCLSRGGKVTRSVGQIGISGRCDVKK